VILIVSPDSVVGEKLAAALAATGEEVQTVTTTGEAVQMAPAARVVVLDLLTEGINGHALKGFPVVVVGVYEDVPTVIGPDRYLKDFTLARLTEAVAAAA
jgi:DNA-binding NtrC family response regulator